MLSAPYERIVQWVAGPLAGAVGFGFTELVTHVGVLSTITNGHGANISKAIVQAVTFLTTAGATYAAHHKWLDNLAVWWGSEGGKAEAAIKTVTANDPGVSAAIGDVNAMVNEILTGQAAAEQIQGMSPSKQVQPPVQGEKA